LERRNSIKNLTQKRKNKLSEKNLVVDRLKFSYEGLFNVAELYNIISTFFYDKFYDWYEKYNDEQITPKGKQIYLVLQPWKNASDYYKLEIKVHLIISEIKEVEVEQKGEIIKINQGIIKMIVDAYVISDRNEKWSEKPLYWFFSVLADKYLFREHYKKFEDWVKSDLEDLMYKIKTYLNVYKYNYNKGKIEYATIPGKKSDY